MRNVRNLMLCALGLLACAPAGCKAPNLQDRMDDASRIFRLNLGLGPGFLVNVQATRFLALGVGMYESRRFGFRNGYGWVWDERRYDSNTIIPIYGWEDVPATVYGGMPVTLVPGDEKDPYPPGKERWIIRQTEMPLTFYDENRGLAEVSANVHLIWLGIDAGVDVGQLLDFGLGWFGLDLLGNDRHTRTMTAPH